jgi:hypothetical protein
LVVPDLRCFRFLAEVALEPVRGGVAVGEQPPAVLRLGRQLGEVVESLEQLRDLADEGARRLRTAFAKNSSAAR